MAEPDRPTSVFAPRPVARRRLAAAFLRDLSRANLAVLLLSYVTFLHVVGLYVFTQGFLLTRLSIPAVSPPYTAASPAPFPATHSKAVIIVIDALRIDFISPHPPQPPSPFHHNVLTLPAELTAADPARSLIFNAFSDPPTTTMQRIKGITTGSLPTFVDAGANFASTAIEEDSLISQLVAANKSVAFMGDDTWVHLFPTAFAHAHPYDSFNVEDLHTVDNGVVQHLFPYLHADNASEWDVLIGHFLGVDHVGHRVGPERETMRTKLAQMDDVLRRVVDRMDHDTLLVVLGDHGMDGKGNHGGDSDLETASALWLYSKGAPLSAGPAAQDWPMYTYPGSQTALRHVNQIDLVPTLALMLGVPIPFNNLGAVIPECFAGDRLDAAMRVNAQQIERYIAEYGNEAIATALARYRAQAAATGASASSTDREVAMLALDRLRALWAQFSLPLIALGLTVLGLSVPTLIALYIGVRNNNTAWDVYVRLALETAVTASAVVSSVVGTVAGAYTRQPLVALKTFAVAFAIVSEVVLILPLFVTPRLPSLASWPIQRAIGPAILAIHAVSFASNSFIMWEDRVVVFLLATIPLVHLVKALTAPTATMRLRIIGFSLAFLALTRIVGTITVCREEQQPYCRVTFYAGSLPVAPQWALWSTVPLALGLFPRAIAITLAQSKAYAGPARVFIGAAWRGVVVANALYWVLEYLESWDGLQAARVPLVRFARLWVARASAGAALGALPYLWFSNGLCIDVVRDPDQTGAQQAVTVFGFANAYGADYLLFLLIPFALVHLVSPPAAQMALCAIMTAILLYLESLDTQRDAVIMVQAFASSAAAGGGAGPGAFEPAQGGTLVRPRFTDAVPLVLLGLLGFFATGHQAVLTSIQWKAAFVGFDVVTYPWSPLLVVLNTWGPTALSALAVPLLAVWNVSPRPQASVPVLAHTLQLALAFATYHATVTLASAVCAAWLRRHLMVWKVFAPRFMLAGCTLLVVDLALIVAVAIGLRGTSSKVWRTFKTTSV